ncbi:MAG: alanine:cation symporter family protein [Shimia sp.]|nr:alanine:cation symporter family protein [Shimia sp.]
MSTVIDTINGLLWGHVLIYVLTGIGIYFTVRFGFIQFRNFGEMIRLTMSTDEADKAGISPFQALAISLASRIGTGNLAGVAVAIGVGGPGAIFWMWVVAMLGMATAMAESALAQLYKVKGAHGNYRGGPAFYIAKGLKIPLLGTAFAVCLIFAFGIIINAVQSNSIAQAMETSIGLPPIASGLGIAALAGLVIFGGIRSIARVAEILVPFMAGIYIIVAIWVLVTNLGALPEVFLSIFRSAFGLQEVAGGAAGGMMVALLNGVKRGLFSNEAGMGSAPNIAAAATPVPHHPVSQGFVQAFGVFVDTILVCTATAVMIIVSGAHKMVDAEGNLLEGIVMTQEAAAYFLGPFGAHFIAFAVLLFAFTTIIACYGYAESGMSYLKLGSDKALAVLRLGVMAIVVWGSVQTVALVFNAADAAIAVMAVMNLFALILLSPKMVHMVNDYRAQRAAGKVPEFHIADHPELAEGVDVEIWK